MRLWPERKGLEEKLFDTKEMITIIALAAPVRRRQFGLRPTRTSSVQVSLDRSCLDSGRGFERKFRTIIAKFIQGIPYAGRKRRGDIEAPKRWTDAVIRQTEDLPKVVNACLLKLTFCLPPDKFPADVPYGPDLDNLTKRALDALQRTVFRDARRYHSCVVVLIAMKTKVSSPGEAGFHLESLAVTV